MTKLEVRVRPDGSRNRLELYHESIYIDDYEHSIDRHVDAKRDEAEGAAHLLLDAYERYGKITVRWNGSDTTSEIRIYQGVMTDPGRGRTVVGMIPKAY